MTDLPSIEIERVDHLPILGSGHGYRVWLHREDGSRRRSPHALASTYAEASYIASVIGRAYIDGRDDEAEQFVREAAC